MPIYAYRCAECGHAKDVLQKLSDPLLTTCPACGAEAFSKQLTAAGFQLKGSGWYATDFKGGNKPVAAKDQDAAKESGKESGKEPGKEKGKETAGKESAGKDAASNEGSAKSSGSKDATAVPKTSAAPPAAAPGGN